MVGATATATPSREASAPADLSWVGRRAPLGSPRYEALLLVASLSLAAGVIHAIAAVEHMGEFALFGAFFACLAAVQLAWGSWIFSRPAPQILGWGVYLAGAVAALWLCSRTVGLPLGPTSWRAEPAGPLDVAATSDELVLAFMALALMRGEEAIGRALRVARWPAAALLVLSGLALFTGAHHH